MRGGRPVAAALAAALLAGCAMTAPTAPPPISPPTSPPTPRLAPPPGYALAWSDEFDRDGPPDPAKWVHDTARNKEGWYNHEQQYYGGPGAGNAVVRGGRLLITARLESPSAAPDWGGQRYTSARLITRGKAAWTYGFFEVRARMPCGRGTWPAIWLVGAGGRWPEDGEIDILEHVGSAPQRVSSAVHTAAGSAGAAAHGNARRPDACRALHDYQLLWTAQGLWFGVDGVVHWHYPNQGAADPGGWPFDRPQFLILNLALGGDLGGAVDAAALPATLEVDHVRVYQPRGGFP